MEKDNKEYLKDTSVRRVFRQKIKIIELVSNPPADTPYLQLFSKQNSWMVGNHYGHNRTQHWLARN